jgi:hypothetical protein
LNCLGDYLSLVFSEKSRMLVVGHRMRDQMIVDDFQKKAVEDDADQDWRKFALTPHAGRKIR